jgi:hypothetical protein
MKSKMRSRALKRRGRKKKKQEEGDRERRKKSSLPPGFWTLNQFANGVFIRAAATPEYSF